MNTNTIWSDEEYYYVEDCGGDIIVRVNKETLEPTYAPEKAQDVIPILTGLSLILDVPIVRLISQNVSKRGQPR